MDGGEEARRPKPASILVPPPAPVESFFGYEFGGLGFSPGPLTLLSSFFSEATPRGVTPGETGGDKGADGQSGGGGGGGYKRNRPTSLAVAPSADSLSHLLMIPSGMTPTPSGLLPSPGLLSPLQSPFAISHQQALAFVTAQAALNDSCTQMQIQQHPPSSPSYDAFPSLPEAEAMKIESYDGIQPEMKAPAVKAELGNPGDDGYNWRKYGQKNVKARECPRSYYRCSHADCPVRKKVETSTDGSISEIIYKGQHNHDPPQSSKRGKDPAQSKSMPLVGQEAFDSHSVADNKNESKESVVVPDDEEGDIPDAKRRNVELEKPAPRTSTEYKIVVQTRSEVDLLDDGYRWRKYGQKVVKGKTHPRSYYRCTYAGCNVRKHVERATSDTRDVTTTYEGKHNHDIPTGKHSSQADPHHVRPQNSGGTNQRPATLCRKQGQIVI